MEEILLPDITGYLEQLRPDRDTVFADMEALASERKFPAVGPDVGRLLSILTRAVHARTVLELGSGFGYSALWFARALPPEGRLVCTDTDPENEKLARSFFRRAGLEALMEFHVGDAVGYARTLRGPFDIVFNDVDKELYPETVEPAARLLRPGGLFITDNALWYGRVTRPEPDDETTHGVCEFNRRLAADPRFETVILPLRDGVSLSLRRDHRPGPADR